MLAQVGLVLALLANVHAYSFKFTNYVTQCGPLSIELTDGAGTPPYNLLLIPQGAYGPPEIRHIQNVQFSDNTYTIDKLAYPANTQFLAMLSDSKGIGTGGTSVAIRVETSGDTSCLGTTQVAPDFLFYIDSAPNVECVTTNLRWQDSVQGQIHIYGVIPGGQSFEIPLPSSGTTATWVTDVRAGTTVQFVASDNRGIGNGGSSELYTIQQGTSQACFANGPVYATTTGNPAGPIIPTGPSSSHPSGGGSGGGGTPDSPVNFSSSPSTGVIVGAVVGVVGGFALIALLGFFLYRRYRRRHRNAGTKEVDLLPPLAGSENHGDTEQYAADPYVVPAMRSTSRLSQTTSGYPDLPLSSNGRRMSESTMTRSEVPLNGRRSFDMSESDAGRSSIQKRPLSGGLHPPSAMRPINIIQHDDGGAVVEDPPSPVTVELPPSYHNIRGKPTDPQPGITDALSSSS